MNKVDSENQFDFICINNCGIMLNYTEGSGLNMGKDYDYPYGLYFMHTKEDTLAYLLKLMNTSNLSEMRMRQSIIVPYLNKYLVEKRNVELCYKY